MLSLRVMLVAALMFAACSAPTLSAAELTVHAAASLADALKEIGATYEKESGDRLVFNFGASSMLARQIEEGAPADLFFSADEAKLDALEKKGMLLADTRRSVLSNLLVIIVPLQANALPQGAANLVEPEFKRIALAETQTVPAGIYAREYLARLGLWEKVQEKVVPMENVRAALAAVEAGNAEAGIVYKTDALLSKRVKVAFEVTTADGPKISYPLAVVKTSKESEHARQLADFMAGPVARAVFAKFGFLPAR